MTVALRSRATRWAILFSNPSSWLLEKGMSYGSAQTRRSAGGRCCALAMSTTAAAARSAAVSLPRMECMRAPGGCLELPQQRAGGRVDRLEPAFHRAVEHDARGRRQRAAVGRQVLLDRPLLLAGGRIPCDEPAAVTARAREHAHDRADVRLTGRVLHLYALVIHADVVRGDVEELGLRTEGGRLLILEADRGGTDTLGVRLRCRPVLRV